MISFIIPHEFQNIVDHINEIIQALNTDNYGVYSKALRAVTKYLLKSIVKEYYTKWLPQVTSYKRTMGQLQEGRYLNTGWT